MTGERAIGTLFDLAELEGWTPEELRTEAALTHYDSDTTPAARWGELETWRGYAPTDDDAAICAAFRARFGSDPARILRQRTVVLAGPVPASAGGAR